MLIIEQLPAFPTSSPSIQNHLQRDHSIPNRGQKRSQSKCLTLDSPSPSSCQSPEHGQLPSHSTTSSSRAGSSPSASRPKSTSATKTSPYIPLPTSSPLSPLPLPSIITHTTQDSTGKYSSLELSSHSHTNFLENVPLAFILLIIAELNGGNRKALNYTMGALLALRIAHAEAGLMVKGNFGDGGVGRPIGYVGSLGVLGGLAAYAGVLVKGYWGF